MSSPIFRRVLLFLVLLTALRLAYVGRVELSPDETYYQMWSERLDWGYYSKGPGIAAVIRAGTTLFGVNEFGVRFFAPMCALATSLLLFGFARRLYGESSAAWTVLLVNLTPLFQAGALLMTIDAPFIFCWTAAMVACWRALESGSGVFWWMLTGVCIGLGYLCKYTCAMELLCVVLALAVVPGWRGEFRRPGFWLMLILAAAVGSPPMIWNATHAWITLDHLRARGSLDNSDFNAPLKEFGEFLGGQFGAYSPLIFAGLLAAVVWGWRRGKFFSRRRSETAAPERLDDEAEKARFLLAFGLPLLVMYGLLAFKTSGEPNWTGPAFVALSVLAVPLWRERALVSRGAAGFCVAALMVGLLMSAVVLGTDALRPLTAAAGFPWPYKADPTARLKGWRSTAEAVANARQEAERELGAPVFLIANRYQLASEMNFYLPDRRTERPGDPPVYMPESQSIETQFSLWPGYDQFDAPPGATSGAPAPKTAEEEFKQVGANPLVGRSALFITDDERGRRVPSSIESGFEECRFIAQYEIRRGGLPLRRLRVYACFNYKGLEL
jgi:4-amino-4-deoxy-L-arabinose transferase-like glycosyltransferase